jgi:hypothetical protein
MKRKISILTLTLLFFAANTALPFTLHICRMMEMTESCEHMVLKEDSCCEEEMEADVYIAAAYDQCCTATIVDPSLKENYLGSKNEISQRTEFLILDFKQEDSSLKLSFNKIKINISPPFSAFQKLYLINSILLI